MPKSAPAIRTPNAIEKKNDINCGTCQKNGKCERNNHLPETDRQGRVCNQYQNDQKGIY